MKMKLVLWRDEGLILRGNLLRERGAFIWELVTVGLMQDVKKMPFGINHLFNPIEVFGLHKADKDTYQKLYHALWAMVSEKGYHSWYVQEVEFDYPGEYVVPGSYDPEKLPIKVFISEVLPKKEVV